MKRWSNSSLQVIDPKASAAPSWSGMMSATIPRSMSDPFDGQCMLTAVLRQTLKHRLSTAVRIHCPSSGSLDDLAAVANMMPEHRTEQQVRVDDHPEGCCCSISSSVTVGASQI